METTTPRNIERLMEILRQQREGAAQQQEDLRAKFMESEPTKLRGGQSDPGFKFFAARGRTLTPDVDVPDVDVPDDDELDDDVPQPRLRVEGELRPEPEPLFKFPGRRIGEVDLLTEAFPSPFPPTEEEKPEPPSGVVRPMSESQLRAAEAASILSQDIEKDAFRRKLDPAMSYEMLADRKLRESWIVQDPIGALFELLFALGEELEKIDQPPAALFMATVWPSILGGTRRRTAELRELGVSDLDAAKIAYEELVPEVWQFVAEFALSPTWLVPLIGAPRTAAKIATGAARLGGKVTDLTAGAAVRMLPRMGTELAQFDVRMAGGTAARDVVRAPTPSAGMKAVEGEFATRLKNIVDLEKEVVQLQQGTWNRSLWRMIVKGTGVNPSAANNTRIGILQTAYERQVVALEELAEVAVSAALDPHAQRFTGRSLLRISSDGKLDGVRWEDVMSSPGEHSAYWTPERLAYHRDYQQVINEMEAMRVAAGLEPRAMTKEGWYYVPRQVDEVRGIKIEGPPNPSLQRVWDTATEGAAANVKYSNDPRANLMVHVRTAYREIAEKQLSDAIAPLSVEPSKLIPDAVRVAKEEAARRYASAHATASRLRALRAASSGLLKAAARKNRRRLDGQIERLEAKIQNLFGKADPQAGTSAADLHARLLRSPVRANGFAASSEAAAKAYFANLRRFIQKVAPDDRDLQAVVDRAEDAYFSGDIAKATATAESALSQGHMIGGASFPDEDLFVRFTQQVESEALRFPAGSELRDLAERHALLRQQLSALKRQRTIRAKEPTVPEDFSTRLKNAEAKEGRLLADLAEANRNWTAALDKAKAAKVAPGNLFGKAADNISVKMWRNNFLPSEDVKLLDGALAGTSATGFFNRQFERLTNTVRTMASTLDFAMPFIQGLPLMARNPAAWGKSTLMHYQAFLDPTVQGRFMREHLETVQKMARNQVPVGDPEFFAALRPGQGFSPGALLGFLPGGDEARRLLRLGGKQTFGRFQSSYNMGLNASRTLLWEATEKSWKGTDAELGRYIRNMTGGLNARSLGAGPTQRSIESMFLAFSPRLFRSTVALVGDALQKGPNARIAQKSLGQLAAAVTGLYVVSGLGLGKSWEEIGEGLNPLNGKKFLSHQINGDWIGFGGQVRAITQIIGLTAAAVLKGEPIQWNNQFENPLLGGWMNRGAVGTQIVFAIGETFTRRDLLAFENLDSLPDLGKFLLTSHLPFAVQGKMEGDGATAQLAGVYGSRSSAETPFEKVERLRLVEMEKLGLYTPPGPAREDLGGITDDFLGLFSPDDLWDTVDIKNQRIINATPAVAAAREAAHQYMLEGGSSWAEFKEEAKDIEGEYNKDLTKALSLGPGERLRKRYGDLRGERADQMDNLRNTPLGKDALAFLEDEDPKTLAFDVAYEEYLEVLTAEDLEDERTGYYDVDERNKRLDALEAKHGKEMMELIQEHGRFFDPPEIKLMKKHKDELETAGWFSIRRNAVGLDTGPFSLAALYKVYEGMEPNDQRIEREKPGNDDLLWAWEKIRADKKEMRKENYRVDAILMIWYGGRPLGPTRESDGKVHPGWPVLKNIHDQPDGKDKLVAFLEGRVWSPPPPFPRLPSSEQ